MGELAAVLGRRVDLLPEERSQRFPPRLAENGVPSVAKRKQTVPGKQKLPGSTQHIGDCRAVMMALNEAISRSNSDDSKVLTREGSIHSSSSNDA